MVAAVSHAQEHEPDPTTTVPEEDAPIDVSSSLRVRKGATHWGIRRYTPNGFERLSFGVHAYTKEDVFWTSKDEYSGETILKLFGPGTYQINWRVIGDGKNQTIGREDINIRGALAGGEPAVASPVHSEPLICRVCSRDVVGRFCAMCGTAAGASAAPAAAAVPPPSTPLLPDQIGLFQLGVSFATSSLQSSAQIARADAEQQIKRFEIETKATLERERMSHEKAMREQQLFFERTQQRASDADNLVSQLTTMVAGAIAPIAERLDAIDERLDGEEEEEEEEDEKPAPTPIVQVQGEWTDKVNAAGAAVEKVVAPTIAAIGDALKSMRSGNATNANGATSHAQSGSGT